MINLRLFCTIIALCAIHTTACGGGAYTIPDTPMVEYADGVGVSDLPYLTVSASLHNKDVIHSKEYNGNRDSSLKYFYVYAEFKQSGKQNNAIPLLLLDLENGEVKETRGAELISKFPMRADGRGQSMVVFRIAHIEKTNADIALQLFNHSKSIVDTLGTIALGTQLAKVLDLGAEILNTISSKKHTYDVSLSNPVFTKSEHVEVYRIFPTDSERRVIQVPDDTNGLTICGPVSRRFVCDEKGKGYRTQPYILVEYVLSDHVSDHQLLGREIGTNCTVSLKDVEDAEKVLMFKEQFSEEQYAQEVALVGRAKLLVEMRRAIEAKSYGTAVDNYFMYSKLKDEKGDLYKRLYEKRSGDIKGCLELELKRLGIPKLVDAMVNSEEFDLSRSTVDSLEHYLNENAAFVDSVKRYEYLRETDVYKNITNRVGLVEDLLYAKRFAPLIEKLQNVSTEKAADSIITELNTSIRTATCGKCRTAVTRAVSDYKQQKTNTEQRAVEMELAMLRERASLLHGELLARERAQQLMKLEFDEELQRVLSVVAQSQINMDNLPARQAVKNLRENLGEAENALKPKEVR